MNGVVEGINTKYSDSHYGTGPMKGHYFRVEISLPYIATTSNIYLTMVVTNLITGSSDQQWVWEGRQYYGDPGVITALIFLPYVVYGTPDYWKGVYYYSYDARLIIDVGSAKFYAWGSRGYSPIGYVHCATTDHIMIEEVEPPVHNDTGLAIGLPGNAGSGESLLPILVEEPEDNSSESDVIDTDRNGFAVTSDLDSTKPSIGPIAAGSEEVDEHEYDVI